MSEKIVKGMKEVILEEGGEVLVSGSTSAVVFTDGLAADFKGELSNPKVKTVAAGFNAYGKTFAADANTVSFTNVTVGTVYGGAYAYDWTAKETKKGTKYSYKISNDAEVEATVGVATLDFNVGSKATTVYGGGYGMGSETGSVEINFNHGAVSTIYGGGAKGAVVTGDVEINIGAADVVYTKDNKISKIYAGGNNSTVYGDAVVTFNASAASLTFNGTVDGQGTGRNGKVLGSSTLKFDDYEGKFNASVKNFDLVQIIGGASVTMDKGQDKSMKGATYEFVITDDSIGNNAMMTWNSKFTGDIVVTVSDDADQLGTSDQVITLIASNKLKNFDVNSIRVQNEDGEVISDLYYDINVANGKVTFTYNEKLDLGDYDKSFVLNDADDYVNVKANSVVTGAIDMAGGDNKLVIQKGAEVTGEIILAEGTNEVVVNAALISGEFASEAGSNNTIKLNSASVGFKKPSDINLGAGDDTVVLAGINRLAGINFGTGNDVLVLNNEQSDLRVTWGADGNDAVVVNYDATISGNNLGLQGTNNALVVGNGSIVTIEGAGLFGNGTFAGDTEATIAGVYLNDNAMLKYGDYAFVQNYAGNVDGCDDDNLVILVNNGAAPESIAPYYTNSGKGFVGTVTGVGTVAFGGFNKAGVAGGKDLVLVNVDRIMVSSNVVAQINYSVDGMGNVTTVPTLLADDAALVVYADKTVFAGNVTKDVDFAGEAYLGATDIAFTAGVGAAVSVTDQTTWFDVDAFNADVSVLENVTFNGKSFIGFAGDATDVVIDWDFVNYDRAGEGVLSVKAFDFSANDNTADAFTVGVSGDIWENEFAKIADNAELTDAVLNIGTTDYIKNWTGDVTASTGNALVVLDDAKIEGTLGVEAEASIRDNVVIENGIVDAIAAANDVTVGASTIYGGIDLKAGDDVLTLNGTLVNDAFENATSIYMDGGNDTVNLNGATVEGIIRMGAGDGAFQDTVNVVAAESKVNAVYGDNVDLVVADGGVLNSLIPETAVDFNATSGNAKATNALIVGDDGTVAADVVMAGKSNDVNARFDFALNYDGVAFEESYVAEDGLVEDFNANINSSIVMYSADNAADFSVDVNANGFYAFGAAGPNNHKKADVVVAGPVNINLAGSLAMGDDTTDRGIGDVTVAADTVNTFNADLTVIADEEGTVTMNGANVNVGAVTMVGADNFVSMVADVYAGEQAVVTMNGDYTVTMNGDLTMQAINATDGTAENYAVFGLWANGAQAAGASPYGNADNDSKDGVNNALDSQFNVVVNGNIVMGGVGDTSALDTDANPYYANNTLRIMKQTTVNGNITMGEYYRDTWSDYNTLIVDDGAVVSSAVAMVGDQNTVEFFGKGEANVTMNGLDNFVTVGGENYGDGVYGAEWDGSVTDSGTAITDVEKVGQNKISYGAELGDIVSDNVYDTDRFAGEHYLNGAARDLEDYADLTVKINGSTVNNITAKSAVTAGNVVGANEVRVDAWDDAAATIKGDFTAISNDYNFAYFYGDDAAASIEGTIDITVDKTLGAGYNFVQAYNNASVNEVNMTLKGEGNQYNQLYIGYDEFDYLYGFASAGEVNQTADTGYNKVWIVGAGAYNVIENDVIVTKTDIATVGEITQINYESADNVDGVGSDAGQNIVWIDGYAKTEDIYQYAEGSVNVVDAGLVAGDITIGDVFQGSSVEGKLSVDNYVFFNYDLDYIGGNSFYVVSGDYDPATCKYDWYTEEIEETYAISSIGNITQSEGFTNQIFLTNVNYGDISVNTVAGGESTTVIKTSRFDIVADTTSKTLDYHEVVSGGVTTELVDKVYGVTEVGNITLTGDGAVNNVDIQGWTGDITSEDAAYDNVVIDGAADGYVVGDIDLGKWVAGVADDVEITGTDKYSEMGKISNSTEVKKFAELGAMDLDADCDVELSGVSFDDIDVDGMISASGKLVANGLVDGDTNISADFWNKNDNVLVDVDDFDWIVGAEVLVDTDHRHLDFAGFDLNLGGSLEFDVENVGNKIDINLFVKDNGVWDLESEVITLTFNEDTGTWLSDVESFACGHNQQFELTVSKNNVNIALNTWNA